MKTYYHVTALSNLPSSKQVGLIPQVGPNARACEESHPSVFLFKDREAMEDALMNWLGETLSESFGEDAALLIMHVTLTEEEANSLETSPVSYEAVSHITITPERLTFYDEEMTPITEAP